MGMTLEDYMALPYRLEIVEDKLEGGFVASYPALPGCLTCGDTIESVTANAIDAKRTWLEAALAEGIEIRVSGDTEGEELLPRRTGE